MRYLDAFLDRTGAIGSEAPEERTSSIILPCVCVCIHIISDTYMFTYVHCMECSGKMHSNAEYVHTEKYY